MTNIEYFFLKVHLTEHKKTLNLPHLINFAANYFNMPAEFFIKQHTRKREIVDARTVLVGYLKFQCNLTLYKIAEIMGFDHSSAHCAGKRCKDVKEISKVYVVFCKEYNNLINQMI